MTEDQNITMTRQNVAEFIRNVVHDTKIRYEDLTTEQKEKVDEFADMMFDYFGNPPVITFAQYMEAQKLIVAKFTNRLN